MCTRCSMVVSRLGRGGPSPSSGTSFPVPWRSTEVRPFFMYICMSFSAWNLSPLALWPRRCFPGGSLASAAPLWWLLGFGSSSPVAPWSWQPLPGGPTVWVPPSWCLRGLGGYLSLAPQPWWLRLDHSLALAATFWGLPGLDECRSEISCWCRLCGRLPGG